MKNSAHPRAKRPFNRSRYAEADPTKPLADFQSESGPGAVKGDQSVAELAKRFDLHPNSVAQWKAQLLENALAAFDGGKPITESTDLKVLHAKIGQQALEIGFLESALGRNDDASAKR